jgi:hypothetical protein
MIGIIYVSLSGLLIGSGFLWLIFKARTQERVSLKQRFRKLLSRFVKKKAMINQEDDNIVKGTHYHLSLKHYNYVRYGVSATILASGITALSSTVFIAAIVFFLASWPQEKFGDMIKLPFYYFCRTIRTIDKDRKDMELMEVLSLLKNMTVQLRNNPLGADYIIEYLAANVDLTKSAFLKMLNQMRLNRMREAEQYFEEEIGTPLAKDVARILLQLDKLNPAEQEEMLVSIQRQIREAKTTVQKARTELMCDLVMIPASITVMLLFINFIVVVMGIDQLNQFQNLI